MAIRYSGLASAIGHGEEVTIELSIPISWVDDKGDEAEGLSVQVGDSAPIWFPKHDVDGDRLASVWNGDRIVFVRENAHTARIAIPR